jgi:hypothetical protein
MASITKDTHQPPKSPFWIACAGKILIASFDCAKHLRAKSWATKRQLLADFEISQTDVSDLNDNALFKSHASK